MRVILLRKELIKSKSGIEYVKVPFILVDSGQTGEIFTERAMYEKQSVSEDRYLSDKALETLADMSEISDVQFDQRGRFVSLK